MREVEEELLKRYRVSDLSKISTIEILCLHISLNVVKTLSFIG
jgi:hypothetical protein